jgi:uncharacterized membrane protein YcaP (DUF421 family)
LEWKEMSFDINTLFGVGTDLNALQMVDRAIAVFMLMLTMIRVAGRRSFGQYRPFDACTTVLLSAVLSRAVVGASPFWPTVLAGVAIVVLHRLIGLVGFHWPWSERLVSGDKRELVQSGERCWPVLTGLWSDDLPGALSSRSRS